MNFFDTNVYRKSLKLLETLPSEPRYIDVSEAEKIFNGVKVCSFTGHRPEKLKLYEESDIKCIELKFKIYEEVFSAINDGYTHFISGMARGTDTWAAEAVLELSMKFDFPVKLFAAVPCPSQDEKWLGWEQERYTEILRCCEGVFLVSKRYSPNCMKKRNEFMVTNSDRIIAVYDGRSGGTENTIELAKKSEKNIRFISLNS